MSTDLSANNNELTKLFYRIREVSEYLDIPLSTLRYWETEFPADVKPIRNAGRTRYYTPAMIETLKMIRYLLYDKGLKIDAVKRELHNNRKNISQRVKIIDTLTSVRDDLKEILSSLEKRK